MQLLKLVRRKFHVIPSGVRWPLSSKKALANSKCRKREMLEALTQGAGIYSSRRAGQTGAAAADGPDRATADGKTQIAQALTCTF